MIYTTNAIESLNSSMRKILKTRRAFPNDEAATKLMYLALQNIAKRWTRPVKDWKESTQSVCHHVRGPSAVTLMLPVVTYTKTLQIPKGASLPSRGRIYLR